MMPRFNLGLLSPQGNWGRTTASFGQMPDMGQYGGLFGGINPPPSFTPYGLGSPSAIMAQLGLGQGRVNFNSKNKPAANFLIGPGWNPASADKNPGTDPYEFGY